MSWSRPVPPVGGRQLSSMDETPSIAEDEDPETEVFRETLQTNRSGVVLSPASWCHVLAPYGVVSKGPYDLVRSRVGSLRSRATRRTGGSLLRDPYARLRPSRSCRSRPTDDEALSTRIGFRRGIGVDQASSTSKTVRPPPAVLAFERSVTSRPLSMGGCAGWRGSQDHPGVDGRAVEEALKFHTTKGKCLAPD